MSLQSVYDVLKPLADQGKLTLLAVQEQVQPMSALALSLPSFGSMQLAGATVDLSGTGADQKLTISARVSWGLFSNVAGAIEVTPDPTETEQFLVNFACDLGDSSGLSIPGVPWFALSGVAINAYTNPYRPVRQTLLQAAEVFISTTLLIKNDGSQTPIPIQIGYDSAGAIQTTLNASSVDLPSINDILAAFGDDTSGINLPDGLNSLLSFSLLEVSVGFDPPSVSRIGVSIGKSAKDTTGWSIIPGVFTLQSYTIDLTITNPLTSASRQVSGLIQTQVSLGNVDIEVAAIHPATGGWQFSGSVGKEHPVPIGELVSGLGEKFGITLPAALNQFTLSDFEFMFDTQTTAASGHFSVNFTINGAEVDLTVTAAMQKSGPAYTANVAGKLVIGTSEFDVSFTSQTDNVFQAKWSDPANPLQFADIASKFGWTNTPAIPKSLDLSLTSAQLTYDFTSKTLLVSATSQHYGQAVFIVQSGAAKPIVAFGLNVHLGIRLADIPLVGDKLPDAENLGISDAGIWILSRNALKSEAETINAAIKQLGDAAKYPTLPDADINSQVLLSGQLTLGTDSSMPFNLALVSSSTPKEAAAAAAAAGSAITTSRAISTSGAVDVLPPERGTTTLSDPPPAAAAGDPGSITWFTVQRSFGPVSIQRVGAMYQSDQETLRFEIDATLSFGPLSFSLLGLGLGSPLTTFTPLFSLGGLGLAYSNPPLTIAGSLVNLAPPGADYIAFEGGVTIKATEFSLMAFGFYGNQGGFNSMFLFGDLAYALGGPPAFFVTGLALGFGYNSDLRIPAIDEIAAFPFVQVLPTSLAPTPGMFGPNPTPQTVLDAVMKTSPPWVKAEPGSLWFGAGITFTSFELVNSQALLLVELAQTLTIALIGTSRAQFPQPVGSNLPVYAYIELDIEVEFSPALGVFSVQAVLAKSSFLLDKACMLTGGFAFFVWYGSNPHAGDFVLSLGGYNSGFTPPSYYPNPPRVGFNWSLDSSITVSGGAYFAFTPSVLMVGGSLNATYQSGNLKAWFDVWADIVVQWKPFWFDAQFGISIGASYKIDLLFTSFTVSVELGCDLELWGPPTGGTVGVDWYIISFSIPFGTSRSASQPKISGWSDVQAMLPNSGSDATPNILTLTPTSGLLPNITSPGNSASSSVALAQDAPPPAPAPWIVRGSQFGFSTNSSVPASVASLGAAHQFQGSNFNVAPLGWTGVGATHVVTLVSSAGVDCSPSFAVVPVTRSLPAQLWGTQTGKTPAGDGQLVPDQLTGISVLVLPPAIGGSAGPVVAETTLAQVPLNHANAMLGVSGSAQPSGDAAVESPTTIGIIADPKTGIGSDASTAARAAIFNALDALAYAPSGSNDSMTKFAAQVGSALAAAPLLVN